MSSDITEDRDVLGLLRELQQRLVSKGVKSPILEVQNFM